LALLVALAFEGVLFLVDLWARAVLFFAPVFFELLRAALCFLVLAVLFLLALERVADFALAFDLLLRAAAL
jgi:hypothetical protein